MLTQNELKEILNYNSDTGIFTRRKNTGRRYKKGEITGNLNNGYVQIMIKGKQYLAHRLAWLYVYGYFPENFVDHKDRIKHHNWIDNLREVTNQCNIRNVGNYKNNTSGVKGISYYKNRNRWVANIFINGKRIDLRFCKSFDEAVCYRLAAEQCVNWEGCDSNSPAYQYVKKNIQKVLQ
jgi:hypothetical protein